MLATTWQEVQEAGLSRLHQTLRGCQGSYRARRDDADDLKRLLSPQGGFPVVTDDFLLLAHEPVTFLSQWRLFSGPGVIRVTLGAYQCPRWL